MAALKKLGKFCRRDIDQMSKKLKRRKPHPSVPSWYWLDTDNCWWCAGINRNGCHSCPYLKKFKKDYREKKDKEKEKSYYE